MTAPTLNAKQVRAMRPCGLMPDPRTGERTGYLAAWDKLPDWEHTGYTCREMIEAGVEPADIVWYFARPEVIGPRAARLAAAAFATTALPYWDAHKPGDTTLKTALEVVRRHARGEATDEELEDARGFVWAATEGTSYATAWDAAWDAAWSRLAGILADVIEEECAQ